MIGRFRSFCETLQNEHFATGKWRNFENNAGDSFKAIYLTGLNEHFAVSAEYLVSRKIVRTV